MRMKKISLWWYGKIVLGLGICFLGFFGIGFATEDTGTQGDLLQQSFFAAKVKENILDLGNTKFAVGNQVVWGNMNVSVGIEGGKLNADVSSQGSIVVRITRFVLMLTVVLAVTMIIFNGMQYIVKSGSGEDPKKVQMNIVYIIVGIMLALFSVIIINLLRSTGNTLNKEVAYNASPIVISSLV